MNSPTATMDLNDLTSEPGTSLATAAAGLVGGFLGLTKALSYFKRERADSAQADADRVKSEADMAAYRRLIELLDISNGTVASLTRKMDEMKEAHAAQIQELTDKMASMEQEAEERTRRLERSYEAKTRRLEQQIVQLGGRITSTFSDSRPGAFG